MDSAITAGLTRPLGASVQEVVRREFGFATMARKHGRTAFDNLLTWILRDECNRELGSVICVWRSV